MNDDLARWLHERAWDVAASVALTLLILALTGCGGGGGSGPSVSGPIVPPPSLRSDILVGYYGDCPTCAMETADHTNLYFAFFGDRFAGLRQARAAGFTRFCLGLWEAYLPDAESQVRSTLTNLNNAGLLGGIECLYPTDEPRESDAAVTAKNAMIRRVAGEFPALAGIKLAVIYASARPGIASYDWVGFDDYNAGCAVLGGAYDELKAALRPDQRILLVPGGADPWRQDPACFAARAHADPQVVAVVPFIWFDQADRGVGAGIRSNPTRKLYCEMGRVMTGRDARC